MGNGEVLLNLASANFAGLSGNKEVEEKAIKALRKYGVGACGPPGFYGTMGKRLVLVNLCRDRAQAHSRSQMPMLNSKQTLANS